MQKGMERALKNMHMEYEVFFYQLDNWEKDAVFAERIRNKIKEKAYDMVLSVNYCLLISDACQENGIRYVSWIYDAPIHIRDISSFHNSCNKIYCFDRGQVQSYRNAGYQNVFHMPLAADARDWQPVKNTKYECDVAFVGRLYKSDYEYLMGPLPQYYRGMFEGFLNAQGQVYGAYFLDSLITDARMEELNEFYRRASKGKMDIERREMEFACACEVTGRERRLALALLGKRFHVHLYSGDDAKQLEGISSCGYVEYYSEMPSAFKAAKINLNISLRAIRTGIPLRVLDVMSCGGFLISNYQEELLEYFEPNVDLVVYEDMKDLVLKTEFYLKHEEERKRIAENGRRKIENYFGYEERMRQLLK